MPYPMRVPEYPWLVSCLSLPLLYLGLYGICMHLLTGKLPILGSGLSPVFILAAWAAVNLTAMVELRFVLPIITYFIVVSGVVVHHIVSSRHVKMGMTLLGIGLIVLPMFFSVAHFVRQQAPQLSVDKQIVSSR
jgi:hypothetical protein